MEKKEKRKSASKWDQCSERALIEVWAEKMVELRGVRKNSHILLEMVAKLDLQGYKYTVPELKTKMHNITARYRKEKQKIGSTGGSPSDWDLYKEVECLLAPSKAYNSEGLVVDSINNINTSISSQTSLEALSPLASTPSSPSLSQLSSSPLPISSPISDSPPSLAPSSPSTNTSSSSVASRKNTNLERFFKKVERNIEQIEEEIKKTSKRVVEIEEEKKNILKNYVDREADVQKALVEFLKRP